MVVSAILRYGFISRGTQVRCGREWQYCNLKGKGQRCYSVDVSEDQQQPPVENEEPPSAPDATPQGNTSQPPGTQIPGADKKVLAGVLGIVLGWVGVHKFVLGYKNEGIIMAALGGGGLITSGIPFVGCVTVFALLAA